MIISNARFETIGEPWAIPCVEVDIDGVRCTLDLEQKEHVRKSGLLFVLPMDGATHFSETYEVDGRVLTLTNHVRSPQIMKLWTYLYKSVENKTFEPGEIIPIS